MPMSTYIREVRELVGPRVLCLPAVTALVLDQDARILLVQNMGSELWTLPGGMIEPGESPATTLVREMHEELNVTVFPESLIGVFGGPEFFITYPNGDQVSYITSVFRCSIFSGVAKADNVELQRIKFMTAATIAELGVEPWVTRVVACSTDTGAGAQFDTQ